jgi:hypothetical protein
MRRGAQNALVALGAVLFSLAGIEAYLRAFALQAIYAVTYCQLGWCHVPGVSFVHGAESGEFVTHVRYNSRGLRDHEYAVEKPEGARRVLIFGDSFAEGLEVELDNLHAKRLERMLAARYPGLRVEVINFGVSAYDTAQEWWNFRTEGVRYRPDLVVVIWTGESGSPYATLRDGQPVFVEPRYTRTQVWLRDARTFLKLHFHTATFLMDRLGVNRSVRQFLDGQTGRPPPINQYQIPHQGLPMLPFSAQWQTQMAIFEDFLATAHARGAVLVVAARSTHEFRYLTEALRLRPLPGLIVVDLQQVSDEEERRHRFPGDGHYNPEGHAKAARILFDLIVRRDLLRQRHSGNKSLTKQRLLSYSVRVVNIREPDGS